MTRNRMVILTLIIIILIFLAIYINIQGEESSNLKGKGYDIKAYCIGENNTLECSIYFNNTLDNKIIYLNKIKIEGTYNIEINLPLMGLSVPEYTNNYIKIIIGNKTYIEEIDYNKKIKININKKIKINNKSLKFNVIRSINATLELPSESGKILTLDQEFQLSNSSINYAIIFCQNKSTYTDIKIFSWNDIIFYEYVGNTTAGCHVLPIPGTSRIDEVTISKITANFINYENITSTIKIWLGLIQTPSLRLIIYNNDGIDWMNVPLVPANFSEEIHQVVGYP